MAHFDIIMERYTTGDVLVADYKLEKYNIVTIRQGENAGEYHLSGTVAKACPLEDMKTKDDHTIKMRAVPLTVLKEERLPL